MASIAEIIRQHEDDIMKIWHADARAAALARGLSAVALEDIMPTYLSALADGFATGDASRGDRPRKHLQAHLASRLREGFDLAEILAEFVLLERCIVAMWSPLPPDQRPSAEDIDRLHVHVQTAITDVSDMFRRHMLEDEQSEKRYLRLLQGIASDALHEDARPLRERLREILDVIMEAMGAQAATFLAYDTSGSKLVLTAATGEAALESHATSLDPMAFGADVAAHEEPTTTSTQLDVPESLRRSGIRSLLGVRLPRKAALLGVLYIGIDEVREFTPREIGRIAALGERLALHLENARLFAALHEKIDLLAVEKALRDHFVSTLAHDLRGPLAAARLAADLLATAPARLDERRELALKIEHNIDRVDHMIRDLLDASRIRAGEPLPLRLDTCDLVAVVHRVAEESRAMHGERFVVDAEEVSVRGIWSEDELHRALWNLVTNAVKYGAPKLPITITVGRRDGGVRVSVHNAGPPIPVTERARIFDAYARARSADAGDRPGWGLGLTLVRGVAEAHGGHVYLTSDPESGTTFAIELPLDARIARKDTELHAGTTVH